MRKKMYTIKWCTIQNVAFSSVVSGEPISKPVVNIVTEKGFVSYDGFISILPSFQEKLQYIFPSLCLDETASSASDINLLRRKGNHRIVQLFLFFWNYKNLLLWLSSFIVSFFLFQVNFFHLWKKVRLKTLFCMACWAIVMLAAWKYWALKHVCMTVFSLNEVFSGLSTLDGSLV